MCMKKHEVWPWTGTVWFTISSSVRTLETWEL